MQESYQDKKNRMNELFQYEYFLSKSRGEFQEWLEVSKLLQTDKGEYIRRETYQLLVNPSEKYKVLSRFRASALSYTLIEFLRTLIEQMKQFLMGKIMRNLEKIQTDLEICIETFRVFLQIGYEKQHHKEIRSLLDEMFLLVHKPMLVLEIAFCLRLGHDNTQSNTKKKMNFPKYDPSIPLFYDQKIEQFCKKYEGIRLEEFEVQNHCPSLYRKIFQKFSEEDTSMALISITSKIFQQKMKDPIVRTIILTAKYIKLDILSDEEATFMEKEQYQKLLCSLIPMARQNPLALKTLLLSEPSIFIEVEKKQAGVLEKWIVEQIERIDAFIQTGKVDNQIPPLLLSKQGIMQFLELVHQIVLQFSFLFEADSDIQRYRDYTRMLQFLKKCYFSFRTPKWFVPVNFLIEMQDNIFDTLHVDIDKEIIATITEMITNQQLPTWIEYKDGKVVETIVTKLEVVSAILYYLKQCHQQDNNFFEFPQPLPVNVASSILLIELVKIRFHDFEPNEQQIEYYRTMFQECVKHNVNPKFQWFKGLDAIINQYDRQIQYDMIKQIEDIKIRKLFHSNINARQFIHASTCLDEGHGPLEIINELKFSIGLMYKEMTIPHKFNYEQMIFELLMIMASLLEQKDFDLETTSDEVRLNHLHLCLRLYNRKITYSPENQQYNFIVESIVIPWIGLNFEKAKLIHKQFSLFFSPFLCTPHAIRIVSAYLDFITETHYKNIEHQLLEQTMLILNMVGFGKHVQNQLQKQQREELVGRIVSLFDESLPKNINNVLAALAMALMPSTDTWLLVLSTETMIQNWFAFIKLMIDFTELKQNSELNVLATSMLEQTYQFVYRQGKRISLNINSIKNFLEMENHHRRLTNYCSKKISHEVAVAYKDLPVLNLVVYLVFEGYIGRLNKIRQIIEQIASREIKQNCNIGFAYLEDQNKQQQTQINPIITVLVQLSKEDQKSRSILARFMTFWRHCPLQQQYFNYARHLGLPQFVQNVSIYSILKIGSDNKHRFTNFVCTVSQVCNRPDIVQQTLGALQKLRVQDIRLNTGALFFLAMIMVKQSNMFIENYIIENLIRCHIFKVRPENPKSKNIVIETLKFFTNIMMKEAKKMIGQFPGSLFKLNTEQQMMCVPHVDKLFGIIYCLPEQCLNEIKTVKEAKNEIEEEEWESQKQSDGENKQVSKKKGKEQQQEQEEDEQEQIQDQQNDQEYDENYSDQQNVQEGGDHEKISDILLNKEPGFSDYNKYIKTREELDIAIKGNYIQLEDDVKNKKPLSEDIEKHLNGIIADLSILEPAQKRIITKMNIHLYNTLKLRGFEPEREPNQDDNATQNVFKPRHRMFSDSEFEFDNGDDNDDNDDDMSSGGGDDDDSGYSGEDDDHFDDHPDTEVFDINSEFTQAIQGGQNTSEELNPIRLENQSSTENNQNSESPIHQFNLSSNLNAWSSLQIGNLLKKQSSVEGFSVEKFKHQSFTSYEIDKIIEILLFKLFDFNIERFKKYLSFYEKFSVQSAGSSPFINSLVLLLRCSESKDLKNKKQFPLLDESVRRPYQFYTNYELFLRNAILLLENIDFKNSNIKNVEGEPGIQSVEFLADTLNLKKQPYLISILLFAYRNLKNDDDQFTNSIEQTIVQLDTKNKNSRSVKTKHIVQIVKASYQNHSDLCMVGNIPALLKKNLPEFLKAYLEHVTPLFLNDIKLLHKRLVELEQQIILKPESKDLNIILMIEISGVYLQNWSMIYYSLKSMLEILSKTKKKKYSEHFKQLMELVFTNQNLILTTTITLHHLNFASTYLRKQKQTPQQKILYLIDNQIRAANLIVMVHSAASKYIQFQQPRIINEYLNKFLFEPGKIKFSSLSEVANLIFPLLDLEVFWVSKYQKVILPPVFEKPSIGYSLPLSFRLISIQDTSNKTQTLQITRQCSFDIAFHQLKTSKFQIQYDQEEGNDQGGLRRQFMRGWKGKGINEQYFFIGKILGIALRDQNLYGGTIDLSMTTALTKFKPNLKLMQNIDPVIHKNLHWLETNSAEGLGLNFTRIRDYYGEEIVEQLKQDGQKIEVTDNNKEQYIDLYIKSYLFAGRQEQMKQLSKGFYSIVPEKCVSILTPQQLLIKLTGVDTIDISQLKKSVRYEGYSQFSEVIKWFWELVESFSETEKQTFLYFLTGTHKIPLGLKNYDLTIERAYDTSRLPVAHTCFNTLDLPEYTTQAIFIEKLRTAIFEGHDTYSIM